MTLYPRHLVIACSVLCVYLCLAFTSAHAQDTTPAPTPAPETTPDPVPDIDAALVGLIDAQLVIVNTDQPLIGEQVQVQIRIETPPNVTIIEWPEFPQDAEPFQVLGTSERQREVTDDAIIHTQALQMVLWESGRHLTPEITVRFSVSGSSPIVAPVESAFFDVPSVLVDAPSLTLQPWLAPRDLPYLSPWVPVGIVSAIVVVLSLLLYLLRRGVRTVQLTRPTTPAGLAIAELQDLREQDLPPEQVYPLVANRVRRYVQGRFNIPATEMTSAELNGYLQERDLLGSTLRSRLNQLLTQADLVKFARFQPDESSSGQLIFFAIRWLQDAEKSEAQNEPVTHA